MSERAYSINNPDGIYFVTFTVVSWIDVFTRERYKEIIVDSLKYCQENKGLEIFAWCLMTNHIHLILRAKEGYNLSNIIRDFKKFTSSRLIKSIADKNEPESRRERMLWMFERAAKKNKRNTNYQLWQHNNHAEELFSNTFLHQKLDYIHQNPVVEGVVENADEYLYSSAKNYHAEKGLIDGMELEGAEWILRIYSTTASNDFFKAWKKDDLLHMRAITLWARTHNWIDDYGVGSIAVNDGKHLTQDHAAAQLFYDSRAPEGMTVIRYRFELTDGDEPVHTGRIVPVSKPEHLKFDKNSVIAELFYPTHIRLDRVMGASKFPELRPFGGRPADATFMQFDASALLSISGDFTLAEINGWGHVPFVGKGKGFHTDIFGVGVSSGTMNFDWQYGAGTSFPTPFNYAGDGNETTSGYALYSESVITGYGPGGGALWKGNKTTIGGSFSLPIGGGSSGGFQLTSSEIYSGTIHIPFLDFTPSFQMFKTNHQVREPLWRMNWMNTGGTSYKFKYKPIIQGDDNWQD